MSYTSQEGRQQLLDSVMLAADEISHALSALSEAYEQLDEHSADELERRVFRPVQLAYGRARRTYTEFAKRHALAYRELEPTARAAPSHGVRELVQGAVDAVARADQALATLQDSLLPVEVGDTQLRAGLEDVRSRLAEVAPAARELLRTFGR